MSLLVALLGGGGFSTALRLLNTPRFLSVPVCSHGPAGQPFSGRPHLLDLGRLGGPCHTQSFQPTAFGNLHGNCAPSEEQDHQSMSTYPLPRSPPPSQGELSHDVLPLNGEPRGRGAGGRTGALPAASLQPGASNIVIQIMTLSGPPKKLFPYLEWKRLSVGWRGQVS